MKLLLFPVWTVSLLNKQVLAADESHLQDGGSALEDNVDRAYIDTHESHESSKVEVSSLRQVTDVKDPIHLRGNSSIVSGQTRQRSLQGFLNFQFLLSLLRNLLNTILGGDFFPGGSAETESPTGSPTTPRPSTNPTTSPTGSPTGSPTTPRPSTNPTTSPTGSPTTPRPSANPTTSPTGSPTTPRPSTNPTTSPTGSPTASPTVNGVPIANDDTFTICEDAFAALSVLDNDINTGNEQVILLSSTQPVNGATTVDGSNVLYAPDANFNGQDTFTYTIIDGSGDSDTATVTVNVVAVNDSPDPADDIFKASENSNENTLDVLVNDVDVDGDTLQITFVSSPSNGVASIQDNAIVYTPTTNFNGQDVFTYNVGDGSGGSATSTVRVNVLGTP